MNFPRIMLAAPASGSGKTMLTCGLLKALKNRGLLPSAFKCGPDYIDPMFHSRIVHTPSKNLDTFFTGRAKTRRIFAEGARNCDIAVIEGVMGYYDGIGGLSVKAGSYDLADVLACPVILVVDVKGMSLSVLAQIKGFLTYRADSHIKGIILNRVSPGLYDGLREKIETELSVRVLGYIPNMPELAVESRHLGLVMPGEVEALEEKIEGLACCFAKTLDLDGIMEIAGKAPDLDIREAPEKKQMDPIRIGVARDEAFCFYYADNLALLEKMGAFLCFFSPLSEQRPPNCDGLLLGGGYPELYAKRLSGNRAMLEAIKEKIEQGCPVLAECGGFMYLHETMEGADGVVYPGAGVIAGHAFKTKRLSRFGYISLTAAEPSLLLPEGEEIRGHEFHYWDSTADKDAFQAKKASGKGAWPCIVHTHNVYAGFPHLYYESNPAFAGRFLDLCRKERQR